MEGAAIFGRRSEIAAVAALLERDHASPAVAADALGDLVAVEGEEFVFAHDLVHAAVLDTVAGRAALEREAVEVLLARGASPAAVGARLAAVAEPGDRRATALLLDAARELGPTDPAAAVELSRRGYTLCADDDPSRPGSRPRPRCCSTRPIAGTRADGSRRRRWTGCCRSRTRPRCC